MNRLQVLEQKIQDLYHEKNPGRADWADWIYENHVMVVARHAGNIATTHGAREELAAAAALHDIADAVMKRGADGHEDQSRKIAQQFLEESGFTQEEQALIVDDAIRYHSCHNGKIPQSTEGKVVATADAVAHLSSDFYVYATWAKGSTPEESLHDVKAWVLKKIERDFHEKILFEDVKEAMRPHYEALKDVFSK